MYKQTSDSCGLVILAGVEAKAVVFFLHYFGFLELSNGNPLTGHRAVSSSYMYQMYSV
jgi:hypothetical protein